MVVKDGSARAKRHVGMHVNEPRQERRLRAKLKLLRKMSGAVCEFCLRPNCCDSVTLDDHIGVFQGAICHTIVHATGLNQYWCHGCSHLCSLFVCSPSPAAGHARARHYTVSGSSLTVLPSLADSIIASVTCTTRRPSRPVAAGARSSRVGGGETLSSSIKIARGGRGENSALCTLSPPTSPAPPRPSPTAAP